MEVTRRGDLHFSALGRYYVSNPPGPLLGPGLTPESPGNGALFVLPPGRTKIRLPGGCIRNWVWELVSQILISGNWTPPMAAHPDSRTGAQGASRRTILRVARIQESNRDALSDLGERELEITVVGDHEGGINVASENVEENMGREIHIAPLLLAMRDTSHEDRRRQVLPGTILNPHRDRRVRDLEMRGAGRLRRQKAMDQFFGVIAPFNPVVRPVRPKRSEVRRLGPDLRFERCSRPTD